MRFIGPSPKYGRIGHQMSAIWQARILAEIFGFQYCHAPFVDHANSSRFCRAAAWNDFFALGQGELAVAELLIQHPSLVHSFGEHMGTHHHTMRTDQTFELWYRLAAAVPDDYVLIFEDLGFLWVGRLRAWMQRGFVATDVYSRVVGWFQSKLQGSALYRRTRAFDYPEGALSVAVYWRRPGADEYLPEPYHRAWAPQAAALSLLRAKYSDRELAVKVFTQTDPGPLDSGGIANFEVICCDDEYPLAYQAMKTLFEADIALTTTGQTSRIIGIYRAGRRPTLADPASFVSGTEYHFDANPPQPLPENFLVQC